MEIDSPGVVIAKRLLDHAKQRGFEFRRIAPGEDGPMVGYRVSGGWIDLIHIAGFSRDCFAWRQRTSSLILPEVHWRNAGWRAVRWMCFTRHWLGNQDHDWQRLRRARRGPGRTEIAST